MVSLKKVPRNQYSRFAKMLKQYQLDLLPFSEELQRNLHKQNQIVQKYIDDDRLQKFWISEKDQIFGFVILQYVDVPDVDSPLWYIVEFYVLPQYRRQKVGERAFGAFLNNFYGDFFYYVLKGNHTAKKFWSKMTTLYNLQEIYRPDVCGDDEVEVRCFTR